MEDALTIIEDKLGDEYSNYPIEIWKALVEYLEIQNGYSHNFYIIYIILFQIFFFII